MTRATVKKICCLTLLAILVLAEAALTERVVLAAGTGVSSGGPGVTSGGPGVTSGGDVPGYLSNLYIWFLGFVGIAALFAIVWGGIQYMFSGANLTKAESGRTWISNAIWGIILAASAYLILYTINPDLVTHGFDINTVIDNALKTK